MLEKGYAEPGAVTFDEIVKSEMKDVILKTIIMANHSGIFSYVITEKEIRVTNYENNKRCVVCITKNEVKAGFIEDDNGQWPEGVNNILYVNKEQKVMGPGAGAEATVSTMMKDYVGLIDYFL